MLQAACRNRKLNRLLRRKTVHKRVNQAAAKTVAAAHTVNDVHTVFLREYRFAVLPLGSAVVGGISSVLQLKGAQTIDASLLYPFITGGSIVFSSLVGILLFREKPTRRMCISIALAFIGTLFFLNLKELLL